jgi:hypothetical protein
MSMTTECPPEAQAHEGPSEVQAELVSSIALLPPMELRGGRPTTSDPAPSPPAGLSPRARKARQMITMIAVGFAAVWTWPPLGTLAFLGLALAVPVLAIAAALGFLIDAHRLLRGNAKDASEGLHYAACTGLCIIGAVAFMPNISMSPVMLDLNGRGAIGTTGTSTAKVRMDRPSGRTVNFDLAGSGHAGPIEWSNGDGAGFLVNDRDGGATQAARTNGRIDGSRLFGDQGGQFASGYDKLALLDTNHDGQLTGGELAGLTVWVDNGDALVQPGELQSLAALGITEIDVSHHAESNARGESLDRAGFTQNGERKLSEDVWFASR